MNEIKTTHFGVHYMLDGYGANPEKLNDKEALLEILNTLPKKVGMYPICEPVVAEVGPNNKKDPGGISGFVMIAESHVSIHTFPNRAFVTIDVYTCNDTLDTNTLTKEFGDYFGITEVEVQIIKRATKYPVQDVH